MKIKTPNILITVLFTLYSSLIYSQTQVSFSNWVQRGDLGNGNWVYDSNNEKLTQTVNGNPTFYVSSDNYINKVVEGNFKVSTTIDDDFVGFVIGLTILKYK